MSFKRVFLPKKYATGDRLTADMISIGLRFGGKAGRPANIEDTIVAASIEGMSGDFRILSMLTEWLDYHIFNVNADRLVQLVLTLDENVKRYWCAVAQWKATDTRFKKLTKLFKGRFEIFPGTDLQIDRKGGEDERFAKTILRVAKGSLRIRSKDILTPEALKEIHPIYRARLMIGPTYRADMWAILESEGSEVPAAEVARRAYGSFTTAHRVKHDWRILKATGTQA